MKSALKTDDVNDCVVANVLAVQDTINVINGKWKAAIIYSLAYNKKRYNELLKHIPKINPRMLSKELKDLEANAIITRTVHDTVPATIEYELTESGQAFKNEVLEVMLKWGLRHREISIGK